MLDYSYDVFLNLFKTFSRERDEREIVSPCNDLLKTPGPFRELA